MDVRKVGLGALFLLVSVVVSLTQGIVGV